MLYMHVCSCTEVSAPWTALHAQVLVLCILACRTCVWNKADLNPRARRILWMASLAWALRSLASLAAREVASCLTHQLHPREDGSGIGISSGLRSSIPDPSEDILPW